MRCARRCSVVGERRRQLGRSDDAPRVVPDRAGLPAWLLAEHRRAPESIRAHIVKRPQRHHGLEEILAVAQRRLGGLERKRRVLELRDMRSSRLVVCTTETLMIVSTRSSTRLMKRTTPRWCAGPVGNFDIQTDMRLHRRPCVSEQDCFAHGAAQWRTVLYDVDAAHRERYPQRNDLERIGHQVE